MTVPGSMTVHLGIVGILLFTLAITSCNGNARDCEIDLTELTQLKYNSTAVSALIIEATGKGINDAGRMSDCRKLNPEVAHYCMLQVKELGLDLNIGLCLPSSCDTAAINTIATYINTSILHGKMPPIAGFECAAADYTITPLAAVAMGLMALLAALMIIGTFIDYASRESPPEEKKVVAERLSINAEAGESLLRPDGTRNNGVVVTGAADEEAGKGHGSEMKPTAGSLQDPVKKNHSTPVRFFLCWSIPYNLGKLIQPTPGNLTSLNGLRAVSIALIILGHTGLYMAALGVQNVVYTYGTVFKRLSLQLIAGAEFSVDSFFFLSGFLVAWGVLGQMEKKKGKIPWGMYVFHRLWRLTPCYAFVMLVYIAVSPLLGSGPLWHRYQQTLGISGTTPADTCSKYWWTNLLYISNFYPTQFEDQCFKWGWYLSVDTQFYLLAPIFLITYYRRRQLGVLLTIGCMLASVAIRGALTIANDLSYNGERTNHVLNEIYAKPWGRISPYLIGFLVAFILKARPHWRVRNRALAFVLHIVAWVIIGACWMGKYSYFHGNRHWNKTQSFFYLTFARFGFSLCVGFLWHASFVDPTNYLRIILGHQIWSPLARLTYNTYLIHPALINLTYYTQPNFIIYSDWVLAYFYCGHLVLSFALATLVFLAVERPFMNLEAVLFRRHRKH